MADYAQVVAFSEILQDVPGPGLHAEQVAVERVAWCGAGGEERAVVVGRQQHRRVEHVYRAVAAEVFATLPDGGVFTHRNPFESGQQLSAAHALFARVFAVAGAERSGIGDAPGAASLQKREEIGLRVACVARAPDLVAADDVEVESVPGSGQLGIVRGVEDRLGLRREAAVDEFLNLRLLVVLRQQGVHLGEDLLGVEERLHGPAQDGLQEGVAHRFEAFAVVDEPYLVAQSGQVALQREGLENAAVVGVERQGQ